MADDPRAIAAEGLEWCRDFREGMFTPARTRDGWSVEMHGLVDNHEQLCRHILGDETPVTDAFFSAADPAEVYRDATFSKATRDWLSSAAAYLRECALSDADPDACHEAADAIRDVVQRWDANEATEFIDTTTTTDTEVSTC